MRNNQAFKTLFDSVPKSKLKLTDEQRLSWLRLIRSENVGPTTFRQLINHFGGAEAALAALPEMAARGGRKKPIHICPYEKAEAELNAAKKYGSELIALGESDYPPWLAALDIPPPLLYVKGQKEFLQQPIISIVGARNGSAIGQKFTRMIVTELAGEGYVIASGLARGIDTAAHVASLESGTIAVVAGGLDVIYPPENADLHAAISDKGLLVTECAPGYKPRAQDFPRRNRIISGLSLAVLVMEAAIKSGSLITARFAAEQGREVFATPGNPLDPRAGGTNMLIKNGANILISAKDVLDVLAPMIGKMPEPDKGTFNMSSYEFEPAEQKDVSQSDRARVIEALSPSPIDIDEIIRVTGLQARSVHIVLLELDLAGRLQRHGRQMVSLSDLGDFGLLL